MGRTYLIGFGKKPAEGEMSEAPSVTTILGDLVDKPFLRTWYAEKAVNCFIPLMEHNQNAMTYMSSEDMKRIAIDYPTTLSNEAMTAGTNVHKAIENFIRHGAEPSDLTPEEENSWMEWRRWYLKHEIEWVKLPDGSPAVELTVFDMEGKDYRPIYAGTLDAIAYVDGVLTLLDWKTSSVIADTYFPQLALYKMALQNCCYLGDTAWKKASDEDEMRELIYPEISPRELVESSIAILRLPKDGQPFEYKVLKSDKQAESLNFGLCLVEAWHWMKNRRLQNKATRENVSAHIAKEKLY